MPLMGNFFFTTPARLSWENIIVPFVTHREFQTPLLVASPLVEDFPVPKFPNDIIGTMTNFMFDRDKLRF